MRRLSREFPVQLEALEQVRQWLLAAFQSQDKVAQELRSDILVAVTEVFVNTVKHSRLQPQDVVEIELEFTEEALMISLRESGEAFDISELPDPDLEDLHESGYGLFIVKSLMDSLEYFPKTSSQAYNVTKMTKGYRHGQR